MVALRPVFEANTQVVAVQQLKWKAVAAKLHSRSLHPRSPSSQFVMTFYSAPHNAAWAHRISPPQAHGQ
jgi:hypothetical protein